MTSLNNDISNDLFKRWSPVIYFNKNEEYFPCSIEWLLNQSELVENKNVINSSPTNLDLYNIAQKYDFINMTEDLVLNFKTSPTGTIDTIHKGQKDDLKDVPIYAYSRKSTTNDNILLTYMQIFGYNGTYSILHLVNSGHHDFDLEHLTVELSPDGKTLIRVFYGAHGVKDGRWIDAKDVPLQDVNGVQKIVAYSAYHGHGFYPTTGAAIRIYGLANDIISKDIEWIPNVSVVYERTNPKFDKNTMGWIVFPGRLGSADGISSFPDKGWWQNVDPSDVSLLNPATTIISTPIHYLSLFIIYSIVLISLIFLERVLDLPYFIVFMCIILFNLRNIIEIFASDS